MPFLEFKCQEDHVTEVFCRTISEGEKLENIDCPGCGAVAYKIFSLPLGFAFYGNPAGYSKPSPTKRFSTKLAREKEGNKHSNG